MSTKTMRLPPRRVLTPSNKRRKEEEQQQKPQSDAVKLSTAQARLGSAPSNQLLAGYLAHEFLTKGTLFGEPWEPKPNSEPAEPRPDRLQMYVAVADLMAATDGSHLAGVVNPSQLASLLHL